MTTTTMKPMENPNAPQLFHSDEFGNVRVIEENGKYLFCALDIAAALGYAKTRNAVNAHCRYALKRGVPHPQNPERTMDMTFIPESDVYRLITHSKLPSADRFERWVFDDVLPTIRQHGMYATPETLERLLGDPDFAIATFSALKRERERAQALEETVNSQQAKIAEMKPKVSYCDMVLRCPETVPISVVAKDYGWTAKKMNAWLYEHNIQYKQGGIWLLYSDYAKQGYTQTRTYTYTSPDGEEHTNTLTHWTQKGRLFLYDLLKYNGIVPLIERKNKEVVNGN